MLMRLQGLPGLPPPGVQYRLFNHSAYLFGIALAAYFFNDPTDVTRAALAGLLGIEDQPELWGCLVLGAGLVGIVCAYRCPWLRTGYLVVIVVAGFMCLISLGGTVSPGAPGQGWIWVLMFGYVCQNTVSDGARATS